jgi:hypothetical protein
MAKLVSVIFTTAVRGKGVENNVIRAVPQLWTTDGKLICEIDPAPTGQPADGDPAVLVNWDAMQL